MASGTVIRVRRTLGGGAVPLLILPLAFFALAVALPLATVFSEALTGLGLTGSWEVTLGNHLFVAAVGRTLLMAAVVTAIAWALGVVTTLALGLARSWLRALILLALLLSFSISLLVRTYGWVLMLQPQGAIDWAVQGVGASDDSLGLFQRWFSPYPAMVHIMLPYMVLPMLAALRAMDPAQLRAARSLGAGPLLLLRRVVLPQLRSGSLAGIVLVFVLSLGFYVTPAFLAAQGQGTIAMLVGVQFNQLYDFPGASAMAAVLVAAVLALYLLADRTLGISRQWERMT